MMPITTLQLSEYNCTECSALRHATGPFVTCPHCRYVDETNMGTDYDYLFGGEFLDSGCRNCGLRLQATYRLSREWITHEVYPQENKNKWIHDRYLAGQYMWDYVDPADSGGKTT